MDKSEQERKILIDQFKIMEKDFGMASRAKLCTNYNFWSFNDSSLSYQSRIIHGLWSNLILVFLLFLYHLSCGHILKKFHQEEFNYSSIQLRIWNEVATIFLVSIVFLVVLKDLLSMGYGLLGLFLLTFILGMGIKIYRKKRLKQ